MMEVYHGSPTGGMNIIIPRVSSHGKPYVYATEKKRDSYFISSKME